MRSFAVSSIIILLGMLVGLPLHSTSAKPRAAERGPHLSGAIESLPLLAQDAPGETPAARQRCTTPTSSAGNILSDCAFVDVAPHNEPHVAVNPGNPNHLVAGANGYEFYFRGGTIVVRSLNDFRLSLDGGHTWTTGFLEMGGFNTATDPVFAFDTLGNAYYTNIGYHTSQGGAAASNGTVIVARSANGGQNYALPVQVYRGTGNLGTSVFNDKEWMTADAWPASPFRNRLYVTWTKFEAGPGGAYLRSPIWFASSSDGGLTWSTPREISGSGAFCTTQVTGPANQCDENQFSVPAVAPNGALYVAFENTNTAAPDFRSQYLVVRSTDGGATWQGPFKVADLTDGVADYPVNVSGRQTLTGVQYRVNSAGNIALGPNSTLYLVWSDNRSGTATATNTDVFLSTSTNQGATWSAPITVSGAPGDQFFPWVAIAPNGTINVAFYDDGYDAAQTQLGVTLARSGNGGVNWSSTPVHTALSDPNRSRWFSAATNGQSTFIGDYNGLAVDSTGRAHLNWTDLRLNVAAFLQIPPSRLRNENIFYASVP
jgi:hypothetical protein